jgi:hypothetical protein
MAVPLVKGFFEIYEPRKVRELAPTYKIPFLFNPDKVTRKISPALKESQKGTSSGRQDNKSPKLPTENISLTVMVAASELTDNQNTVMPLLTALQWLLYPLPSGGPANSTNANHVPKYEFPFVMFVWGSQQPGSVEYRLPVKITSINMTEQEFDRNLSPVRAEVQISMDVITSDDKKLPEFVKGAYNTATQFRERMVNMYKVSGPS